MLHHGAGLRQQLERAGRAPEASERLIHALSTDWNTAELDPAEREMLGFAVRLTQTAAVIEEGEIARLREAGFGDREIHDLCAIVSYFNFVNRMAIGLGIELEDRFR